MGEEPKKPVWGPEDLPASKPRPAAGKPIALPAKAGDDAAGGQEATARPLQMAIAQRAQLKAVEPAPSVGAKEEPAPAPRPEPPATAKRAAEPVATTAHAASEEATSAAAMNPAAASSASVIDPPALAAAATSAAGRPRVSRGAGQPGSEERTFASGSAAQVGIVGGKAAGKSYLFQSMVYRTTAGSHAGALNYYLRGIDLVSASHRDDPERTLVLSEFKDNYVSWRRLNSTTFEAQTWYRLSLHYRCGLFGRSQATLDVEFFDGSGELFFEVPRNLATRQLWKDAYLEARTMIFCLPLWAVFPGEGLTDHDWQEREDLLKGFDRVVRNYSELRTRHQLRRPVNGILALTQADDRRTALQTLQKRWIEPYMQVPDYYLRRLRRGAGVARYLANARQVSSALHDEFDSARDPQVASIPDRLDFGRGRPWLIPMSAIDGDQLDAEERSAGGRRVAQGGRPPLPVPVHVELPLLVALCDRYNALM